MGYATPWLKNQAYSAASTATILYSYSAVDTNATDVYKTYLFGMVAESVIPGSQLRFNCLLDQECDVLFTINGVTVLHIVANYVGPTWVSNEVAFDSALYPPTSVVTLQHKRNGAAPAESLISRFEIYGRNTPILLNP